MSKSRKALNAEVSKTAMQKILDVVESVGNKVPHPVVIFSDPDRDRDRPVSHPVSGRRIGFLSGHQSGHRQARERDDDRQQPADG